MHIILHFWQFQFHHTEMLLLIVHLTFLNASLTLINWNGRA